MPSMENRVVGDRVTRERTFDIAHLRDDGKDALAQIYITIKQALEDAPKFTGKITVNVGQGVVASVTIIESQKVPHGQ